MALLLGGQYDDEARSLLRGAKTQKRNEHALTGCEGLTIWGARGSYAVGGEAFNRYGGATTCFELSAGENRRFLVDGGSGLINAGQSSYWESQSEIDVFLTHLHFDHLLGIPFFAPVYQPEIKVRFWCGLFDTDASFSSAIERVFSPPFLPIDLCSHKNVELRAFSPGDELELGGVRVETFDLHHPGGGAGLIAELSAGRGAIVCDHEHGDLKIDQHIRDVMRGAAAFIYDATYLPEEYHRHIGWGHSTWAQAVDLAEASGAVPILSHHAPDRTDADIEQILLAARQHCPETLAARSCDP